MITVTHNFCATFKTRRRDWEVNIVTEDRLFENVQQTEKKKCFLHLSFKVRFNISSPHGRDKGQYYSVRAILTQISFGGAKSYRTEALTQKS